MHRNRTWQLDPTELRTQRNRILPIEGGDGSTLSLDFTTGVLDPRLSFTRYVTTMAAAPTNDPTKARFDYDPTTLAPRGLLIEGTSTNLVAYSEGMATNGPPGWSGVNITRTASTGGTAPDGSSNTATKFRSTAAITSSTEYIHTLLTGLTTGATYTFSMWAKADGAEWIWVSLRYFGVDNGSFFQLTGDGVLGNTTGTIAGKSIVKYPNGWYRISISHVLTGSTVAYPFFIPCTSNGTGYASITGQTPNGVLCWGGQVELGSGASSYIPTVASQVTRVSEVCYITNTDYGFTTTGGTYFVEWERGEYDNPTVSGSDCFAFSTDYASGRWLAIYTAPGSTTTSAGAWSGGINQSSTAVTGRNRAAVSYAGWNATTTGTLSVNGGSPTTSATMALGTTPTYLMIGAASQSAPYNGGGLRDILGNRVRRLKYWPFVLPSTTLQSITVNTP
jgi:hypothetical protein